MKLHSFSITNFRSITTANKVVLKDTSVLIGKNNEGKSNVIRALAVAMSIIGIADGNRRRYSPHLGPRGREFDYRWKRDFPIQLQERKSSTDSIFRIEFNLDENELKDFKDEIGVSLNGFLTLEVKVGKRHEPKISVKKKGTGTTTLNKKVREICKFINKKIIFDYIPAIRTEKEAEGVVNKLLASRLRVIDNDPDYIKALEQIKKIQQPILDAVAGEIKVILSEFIPTLKGVTIEIQESKRRYTLREQMDFYIDDGKKTNLAFKGEGVKSLAAIAILKNGAHNDPRKSIIAIEEPESHLHPGAIHILRNTIYTLSSTSQVILTTHNPLFVDRENLSSNIIVNEGKAKVAKNIKDIRDLLGVKYSDNLIHARNVLVVEGEDDKIALEVILKSKSELIKKALNSHTLLIKYIGGAGNLGYEVALLKDSLCSVHVFLDNDQAGREAFDKANKAGRLEIKEVTFLNCLGMPNSEFEDCLNPIIYYDTIKEKFGVDLSLSIFKGKDKWSDRVKKGFLKMGKPWTDHIESQVKYAVANEVRNNPVESLIPAKSDSITALITNLEYLITKIQA